MNTPQLRVAVAQSAPAATADEAIEKIAAFSRQAVAAGAGLVLFPEAFVGGYPRGATFGAVVGSGSVHPDGTLYSALSYWL